MPAPEDVGYAVVPLGLAERLKQVREEVLGVFDAGRQPDQVRRHLKGRADGRGCLLT
jgi:hypothetical protein